MLHWQVCFEQLIRKVTQTLPSIQPATFPKQISKFSFTKFFCISSILKKGSETEFDSYNLNFRCVVKQKPDSINSSS